MELVIQSFGCLLVVIGGIVGATGEFAPGHAERVLTYVGMSLICVGLVSALFSMTVLPTKTERGSKS